MKLSDGIINCPISGECEIDVDKIVKCWRQTAFVSRYHDQYRLVCHRAGVKITLFKKDALEIIKRLGMIEDICVLFNHAGTFRK